MSRIAYVVAAAFLLAFALPAVAGPFADVPTDHWAYDAVDSLQSKGIITGYPEGTWLGKKPMTRYEFAVAIARAIDWLRAQAPTAVGATKEDINKLQAQIDELRAKIVAPPPGVTPADLDALRNQLAALEARVKALEAAPPPKPEVTKADLDQIRRLADEFRDELTAMGTDVEDVKKTVEALTGRVEEIERKMEKVQISGEGGLVWRLAKDNEKVSGVEAYDLDFGVISANDKKLWDWRAGYDLDLTLKSKIDEGVTAGVVLETLSGWNPAPKWIPAGTAAAWRVWKAWVETPLPWLPEGTLTLGNIDAQFTPYTLKLVDPDVYTYFAKTDLGNYNPRGIKVKTKLVGLDLTGFMADSQDANLALSGVMPATGARVYLFGLRGVYPLGGEAEGNAIGFSWLFTNRDKYVGDHFNTYGVDLKLGVTKELSIKGEWAQVTAYNNHVNLTVTPTGKTGWNTATDIGVVYTTGPIVLDVSALKEIDANFGVSQGYWGRIGNVKNPTNITGFGGKLDYAVAPNIKVRLGLESYTDKRKPAGETKKLTTGVTLVGLDYGLTEKLGLSLDLEQITAKRTAPAIPANLVNETQTYTTIGLNYALGDNTSLKLLYQLIDFNDKTATPGNDYSGTVAVSQLSVKF